MNATTLEHALFCQESIEMYQDQLELINDIEKNLAVSNRNVNKAAANMLTEIICDIPDSSQQQITAIVKNDIENALHKMSEHFEKL